MNRKHSSKVTDVCALCLTGLTCENLQMMLKIVEKNRHLIHDPSFLRLLDEVERELAAGGCEYPHAPKLCQLSQRPDRLRQLLESLLEKWQLHSYETAALEAHSHGAQPWTSLPTIHENTLHGDEVHRD